MPHVVQSTVSEGPMAPSARAITALRPVPRASVQLATESWLGAWQRRNEEVTLPHVLAHVAGEARANLLRVLDPSGGPHSGMVFTDSDIYKALEGVIWAGCPDALRPAAQAMIDLLTSVVEPDGYLNSFVQGDATVARWSDPQEGHELYSAGHLIQASVAAMRMGVFPDLVQLGVHFGDLLVATFGGDGPAYVEGHPLIEMALVELYRATGEDKYLALAVRQLNDRGHGRLGEGRFGSSYFQDERPVRESSVGTGHAVRQLYLLAGATDVAVETDDSELLAAVERVWEDLYTTKTYVTGVHGSRYRDESIGDRYELPPDRAYAETCAAIAAFQLNWRLLMATGKTQFAEAMEVSLYNAIPASTSADGGAFTYVNPLQARSDHHGTGDTSLTRQPWFDCACCPPNLARLLASLHDYVATTSDLGLQLHLIGAGVVEAAWGGSAVRVEVKTAFPHDGAVLLSIDCEDGTDEWELSIRVPSWSSNAVATLDGEPVPEQVADGYLRLRRDWSGHHQLRLDLSLIPRVIYPNHRVDAVRGCVAIARGPFIYALEQADLPTGTLLEDVALISHDGHSSIEIRDGGDGRLRVMAVARAAPPAPLYAETPDTTLIPPFMVPLVPYYSWGNRGAGAMRVWIPVVSQQSPSP